MRREGATSAANSVPSSEIAPDPTSVLSGRSFAEMTAALAQLNAAASKRMQQVSLANAEAATAFDLLLSSRFQVTNDAANGGPLIDRSRHYELAQALKDELQYRLYITVCASHWRTSATDAAPASEHFEVATALRRIGPGSHVASWRVRLEPGQEIVSLVPLFAGADWQEREQFDLVGVRFTGHPNLRRLMMPDEWEGHPLRKDYAIDTRCSPWR